jgi:hypothetical protein
MLMAVAVWLLQTVLINDTSFLVPGVKAVDHNYSLDVSAHAHTPILGVLCANPLGYTIPTSYSSSFVAGGVLAHYVRLHRSASAVLPLGSLRNLTLRLLWC